MSMNLQPFNFEGKGIRISLEDDQPWLSARDVCAALDIGFTGHTLDNIRNEWIRSVQFTTQAGLRSLTVISEPAVYKLAFRSHKPEAERLTDWLAAEVLPSIRKTGGYQLYPAPQSKPKSPMAAALDQFLEAFESQEQRVDALEARLDTLPVLGEQADMIHKLYARLEACIGDRAERLFREQFEVSCLDLPQSRFNEAVRFLGRQLGIFETMTRKVEEGASLHALFNEVFSMPPKVLPPKTSNTPRQPEPPLFKPYDFEGATDGMHGWFTTRQIAETVGCRTDAIHKRVRQGRLPRRWAHRLEKGKLLIYIP